MNTGFWRAFREAFLEHFDAARAGIPVYEMRLIRKAETEALARMAESRSYISRDRYDRAVAIERARRERLMRSAGPSGRVH